MKVGTHEKSYKTFVGNAIYVSVLGLIDPPVTKHSILKTTEEVLEKETIAARKQWIDKDTLELMYERRRYKNAGGVQGKTQYKRLRNEVQRRFRKARSNWIERKCKEVESLFKTGKVDAAPQEKQRKLQEKTN